MSSKPDLVVSRASPASEDNSSEGRDSNSNDNERESVIVSSGSELSSETVAASQTKPTIVLAPSKFGSVSSSSSSNSQSCFPKEPNLFNSKIRLELTEKSSTLDSEQSNSSKFFLRPSGLKVSSSLASSAQDGEKEKDAVADSKTNTFSFKPLATTGNLIAPSSANVQVNGNGPVSVDVSSKSAHGAGVSHAEPSAASSSENGQAPDDSAPFVFGQNLQERAILPVIAEADSNTDGEAKVSETASEAKDKDEPEETSQNGTKKRAYEAITGEEDESNVLQVHCKLYSWEAETALWKEKGKGFLKLNDRMKDDKLCSRLVMRTAGSLKVILNCSLVVGMKFTLTADKHFRFTNVDGIFLVKGKDKDMEQLNSAIEHRLRELSKRMKSDEDCDRNCKDADSARTGPEVSSVPSEAL
ncbi:Ran-binding protein 3 [Halotydeus destructor]|nr:Ran-binding protein 3 [Halotydeus destructor]